MLTLSIVKLLTLYVLILLTLYTALLLILSIVLLLTHWPLGVLDAILRMEFSI